MNNVVAFDGYAFTATGPAAGELLAAGKNYQLSNIVRKGKIVYANAPGELWFHPRVEFDFSEADAVHVVVTGAGPENVDRTESLPSAAYDQVLGFMDNFYKDQA